MHMGRDGVWFYVDLSGFLSAGREKRRYEMICLRRIRILKMVSRTLWARPEPIWAHVGPYGPMCQKTLARLKYWRAPAKAGPVARVHGLDPSQRFGGAADASIINTTMLIAWP